MRIWIDRTAWIGRRAQAKAGALERAEVRRVAVIKHAALGDMLLTRPFLITAREFFPAAELTLSVTSTSTNGLPEDLVDRVHVIPRRVGDGAGLRETARSFRALGRQDVLFDLAATARSHWVTALNPAGLKVGFQASGGRHRLLYDIAVPRNEYKFEAETFLDQINTLGALHEWPLRFDLPDAPRERTRDYLLYFTGAAAAVKCWPTEHFSKLLAGAVERYPDLDHVVLRGLADWEREAAEEAVRGSGRADRIELADGGEATLGLLQGATALVSNDTGVRNYAIAAGTPTVGIFFATLPFRYLPRFGLHRAVHRPDGGAPDVEDVAQALARLLAEVGVGA